MTSVTYEAIRQRWQAYCQAAGVTGSSIHTLRHAHAVELIDGGVRIETIRKRLGHAHLASTSRYAQLADRVADDEIRGWRRAGSVSLTVFPAVSISRSQPLGSGLRR